MTEPVEGLGGMQKVVLRSPKGSTAEVYLYGAHVTSWTVDGKELIFVSKQAVFKPPKAIRGGIPICWPQFSDFGSLQSHGFARNTAFQLLDATADSATLSLRPPKDAPADWPPAFELQVTVTVRDAELQQEVRVVNSGEQDLSFTAALHSYFRIGDITQATVENLGDQPFLDNLDGRSRKTQPAGPLRFDREVDRIYVGAPEDIKVNDGARGHSVRVRRQGWPDAVVWNPWIEKAKATGDFGDEEYQEMVCVEAAVAPSGPVVVKPGADAAWQASQTLIYEPGS